MRGHMNRTIIFAAAAVLLLLPMQQGYSAEEYGLHANGEKTFTCSIGGKVGRARVQHMGGARYRVFGPHFKGEVNAESFHQAAKRACGEPME